MLIYYPSIIYLLSTVAYRNSLPRNTTIAFWKPQASVRAVLDRNSYPAHYRKDGCILMLGCCM